MKIVAGVYRMIIDGKSYIGSSINIYRRWEQHRKTLELGSHDNPKAQAVYNKCGRVDFELMEELYDADAATLADRETYYIKKYKAELNIREPIKNSNAKPIYQFDLNGTLLRRFSSVQTAAIATGISISNLFHAAQENEKLTRTAGGYYWRYTDTISISKDKRLHNIYVYDLWGNYLYGFESLSACKEILFKNIPGDHNSRINRVVRGLAGSYLGYRFSYDKVGHLDNSKLLTIKSWFPIVQIAPDKKTFVAVYETASVAAKKYNIRSTSELTFACTTGRRCKGYYWTRLGTKWSELLEHPEGTETTTESETIDGTV